MGHRIWTLVKDSRTATCEVQPITGLGIDLRLEVDGQLVQTEVFKIDRPSKDWLDRADEWKGAFEALGWTRRCT